MSDDQADATSLHAPLAQVEHALIDQLVRARGYDPLTLDALPEHERETLLKEASLDASAKLTEIEARSHFLHEVHDSVPSTT